MTHSIGEIKQAEQLTTAWLGKQKGFEQATLTHLPNAHPTVIAFTLSGVPGYWILVEVISVWLLRARLMHSTTHGCKLLLPPAMLVKAIGVVNLPTDKEPTDGRND